jgi:2-polyprenyl-3-methyl-5-hydroxy-6-metoxy-1,4-benzoquinol methylase
MDSTEKHQRESGSHCGIPSNEKTLKRICPICANPIGRILHRQSFLLEENHPLPAEYDVVACTQCNFVYADVDASQKQYDHYYQHFSKYEDLQISSGGGSTAWDDARLTVNANVIASVTKSNQDNILDIGSANGGLLEILSDKGFRNLYAIEPSQACVNLINGKNLGIQAMLGSVFEDLQQVFGETKFKVIIMSHVMEHIYDMRTVIKNIGGILAHDGRLYIEVPDATRYAEFFKNPFHYFDVEHINHFSESSLATLFKVFGYESIESGTKAAQASESEFYPAVFHVFRKTDSDVLAIKNYVEMSASGSDSNLGIFDALKAAGTPIAVWGIGSYTKGLLANTELKNCNIHYLIDADKKRHGTSLAGHVISSPDALSNFDGTILITSALFAESIATDIRLRGYPNKTLVV